jgi:hypothetical protein
MLELCAGVEHSVHLQRKKRLLNEVLMLSKCANPACSNPFRRLSDGKLFQVETETCLYPDGRHENGRKKPPHRLEYYWLCTQCAAFVTLAFDQNQGIMTVPLPKSTGNQEVLAIDTGSRRESSRAEQSRGFACGQRCRS